jgi:hypothetical protein
MKVAASYYDEIFDFKGQWDLPSKCGLKIIRKEGKTYVVVTELYQDNPGTSVTQAGKLLALQICEREHLSVQEIIYLECTPDTNSVLSFYDEEYFEVKFKEGRPPEYRQWWKGEISKLFGNHDDRI